MGSKKPIGKVTAGLLGGAVSVIVVWVVSTVGDVEVPATVASSFTTLVSFACGYIKAPPGDPDT